VKKEEKGGKITKKEEKGRKTTRKGGIL